VILKYFCIQVIIGDSATGNMLVYATNKQSNFMFQQHTNPINRFKLYMGKYLASSSADKLVKIWNINTWDVMLTYVEHTQFVYGLEFLDEQTIASGAYDGTIKIWSFRTGLTNRTISTGTNVNCLQYLSKTNLLLSGDSSKLIKIYNLTSGVLLNSLAGHNDRVNDFALISDNLVASASSDQKVIIWNIEGTNGNILFTLNGHTNAVFGLKLLPCNLLASGSFDNSIRIWNLTNGQAKFTLSDHTYFVQYGIDLLSEDILVSGSRDKTINFWQISTGKLLDKIHTNNIQINALVVLEDQFQNSSK
jgi:WD40 repeat protein